MSYSTGDLAINKRIIIFRREYHFSESILGGLVVAGGRE